MTTSRAADLPVVVDRSAAPPLAAQISEQVRVAVTAGVLAAGERLPSTRDLAAMLGVSRTVVTTAYVQLFAEGWLEGRHGSGTYVANVAPVLPTANGTARPGTGRPGPGANGPRATRPRPGATGPGANGANGAGHAQHAVESALDESAEPTHLIEMRPGIPWVDGIEPAVWRRTWRTAGTRLPSSWPDPHGVPELRAELADYLRRSRGLNITPAHVLVTRGVASGLALLAPGFVRPGDKVGVEDPGYPSAREVLRRAGAHVVPCRVDAHGIVPEELPGDLRLLYTTPAHQYPLGGRLPVARRQALIGWARATGAVVVEDDYDSEFRYDVGPLPSLYSMDPEVIVYLGTTSKMLAPVFGAGWLVASPDVVDRLAGLRMSVEGRVPEAVQYALLALLTSGDLERHVRRMRLEYARRRAALVDTLTATDGVRAPANGTFRLLGDTAGMHVVLELPPRCPADRLVDTAADRGIALWTLDRYYAGPTALNGLILGYGATPLTKVRRAATELRALLAAAVR
jgi:GntR family transcriptional regulator / MocR family aminotransferase